MKNEPFLPSSACKNCSFDTFCRDQDTMQSTHIVSQRLTFPKRILFSKANQPLNAFYAVCSGMLKAYDVDMNGRERITHFYLPGEIVGFESLKKHAYPFALHTSANTTLCEIPFTALLNLISKKADLQLILLQIASQYINRGSYLTYFRADQRLAGFLIDLGERLHAQTFELPMSRQTIGKYLGLAGETVIRLMQRFQKSGLISHHEKKLQLNNLTKLRWIVQGGDL